MRLYWELTKIWIEIKWIQMRELFGYKQSTEVIPEGIYCYNEECCPYFRSTGVQCYSGCTYVKFVGDDLCHWDQCKICGIKYSY